ncbi:hypothetical protein KCU65_g278, partial [Aureobasidium melanogenum]
MTLLLPALPSPAVRQYCAIRLSDSKIIFNYVDRELVFIFCADSKISTEVKLALAAPTMELTCLRKNSASLAVFTLSGSVARFVQAGCTAKVATTAST